MNFQPKGQLIQKVIIVTVNEGVCQAVGHCKYEQKVVDAIVNALGNARIDPEHDRDEIVGRPADQEDNHDLDGQLERLLLRFLDGGVSILGKQKRRRAPYD
jgi:hypothetical protein